MQEDPPGVSLESSQEQCYEEIEAAIAECEREIRRHRKLREVKIEEISKIEGAKQKGAIPIEDEDEVRSSLAVAEDIINSFTRWQQELKRLKKRTYSGKNKKKNIAELLAVLVPLKAKVHELRP